MNTVVNCARKVILGWFGVALDDEYDRFYGHLSEIHGTKAICSSIRTKNTIRVLIFCLLSSYTQYNCAQYATKDLTLRVGRAPTMF